MCLLLGTSTLNACGPGDEFIDNKELAGKTHYYQYSCEYDIQSASINHVTVKTPEIDKDLHPDVEWYCLQVLYLCHGKNITDEQKWITGNEGFLIKAPSSYSADLGP